MQKEQVQLPNIKLVGVTVRTNNKNEINPETSKIAGLANSYWSSNIANGILHRSSPGVTYAVYTDFESDENGEYTYFIGEAVGSFDGQDLSQFEAITIPESSYQKFTTAPGKIPDVVVSAWQQIWAMNDSDFGGKRTYQADFEVYDQRALDPDNVVLDIYIGIKI